MEIREFGAAGALFVGYRGLDEHVLVAMNSASKHNYA
jgi:hypothetical protein